MKYLIQILFFSLVFAGCSGSKKTVLGPPPVRTKDELISSLQKRNYDFTWFNGKASTELKSPDENISGSIHVRMRKDSVVWMALKKFGIEAARIQVDKNHYTVLYRLEGLYQHGRIADLNDVISISPDFADLQQLMFGNVILPDSNSIEVLQNGKVYTLKTIVDGISIDYEINAYDLILEKAVITDRMKRTAKVSYKDYRKVNNGHLISFDRKFEFPYSPESQASFSLKFSEIEVDVPAEIKFNIPKSYSEIN